MLDDGVQLIWFSFSTKIFRGLILEKNYFVMNVKR
jgi:hypothetical protein